MRRVSVWKAKDSAEENGEVRAERLIVFGTPRLTFPREIYISEAAHDSLLLFCLSNFSFVPSAMPSFPWLSVLVLLLVVHRSLSFETESILLLEGLSNTDARRAGAHCHDDKYRLYEGGIVSSLARPVHVLRGRRKEEWKDRDMFLDGDDARMTRVGGMTAAPRSFVLASVLADPTTSGQQPAYILPSGCDEQGKQGGILRRPEQSNRGSILATRMRKRGRQ
jgi:hypothetical protein